MAPNSSPNSKCQYLEAIHIDQGTFSSIFHANVDVQINTFRSIHMFEGKELVSIEESFLLHPSYPLFVHYNN